MSELYCKASVAIPRSYGFRQCSQKPMTGSEYCVRHDPKKKEERDKKRGPGLVERQALFRVAFEKWLNTTLKLSTLHSRKIMHAAWVAWGITNKDQVPLDTGYYFKDSTFTGVQDMIHNDKEKDKDGS